MPEPGRFRQRRAGRARRRLRRRTLLVLGFLGVLVLAGIAWTGWRAYGVYQELDQTRTAARQLQSALDRREVPAARTALSAMQQHSTKAATETGGTTWRVVSSLPVVGDDARAVRTISDVVRRVSDQALPPVLDAAQAYVDGRLTPHDSIIPVAPIRRLQAPLATSASVLDDSAADLQALDGHYAGPVTQARDQLAEQVRTATSTLSPVVRAVDLMPAMLGDDGPRTYLLVLQNNAEIRSTGGFPGSTFLLRADDGRISLSDPVSGATLVGEAPQALPVSTAERTLFGDTIATSFTAAAKEPDFPRAADLMAERYQQRAGIHLDGVVATDPVMLSYLIGATGPVSVDGITLTQQNAVRVLLSDAYARYADPNAQDAFFQQVGENFFGQLASVSDPQALVAAVRRGVGEGRLLIWSRRTREESALSALSGAVPDSAGSSNPHVGVYLSDETPPFGSKLSYYLSYDVAVSTTDCAVDRRRLGGLLALRSSAPAGGAGLVPYVLGSATGDGTETLEVFLLGPSGGTVGDVRVGGATVASSTVRYHGRPAARIAVAVPAGGLAQVTWQMTAGAGDTGPVDVDVTPSVQAGTRSSTLAATGTCGPASP